MPPLQISWIAIFAGVLVWSGIGPHDYPTWILEVAPALLAAAVLWVTRERFPLTRLTYILILIHSVILIVCVCLAISALYELVEWWVALLSANAADLFLGTQGYVWDTQSDMWFALLGSVIALAVLGRLHDRQLQAAGRIGECD